MSKFDDLLLETYLALTVSYEHRDDPFHWSHNWVERCYDQFDEQDAQDVYRHVFRQFDRMT